MKKQILAACIFGLAALPAAAEGIYVLGDIGKTEFSAPAFEETDTGFAIGAGYKINGGFAVEAAYRNLGSFGSSVTGTYEGYDINFSRSFDITALQVSVVGTIPFTDAFSAYARLGYAKLRYDLTDTASAVVNGSRESESESASDSAYKATYGLGARYALNDQIGLRLEYNEINEWEGLEVSAITLGADYSF